MSGLLTGTSNYGLPVMERTYVAFAGGVGHKSTQVCPQTYWNVAPCVCPCIVVTS